MTSNLLTVFKSNLFFVLLKFLWEIVLHQIAVQSCFCCQTVLLRLDQHYMALKFEGLISFLDQNSKHKEFHLKYFHLACLRCLRSWQHQRILTLHSVNRWLWKWISCFLCNWDWNIAIPIWGFFRINKTWYV